MPLMPKSDPLVFKDIGFKKPYDHIGHSGGEVNRVGHFIKVNEVTPGHLERTC